MPFVFMILMLAALVGFCFPRALSFSGIQKRRYFVAIAVACFFGIGVTAPRVGDQQAIASTQTTAPATVATTEQGVDIGSVSWRKESGAFMKASFSIINRGSKPVKDVIVRCDHSANSGTIMDSNTRTVYEVVRPRESKFIADFDMGFIHSQAVSTKCRVVNYSNA